MSTLYGGTVLVAALYFGRELVVPLVLASLLAFVLAPACALLQRLRLPKVAAVMVVVLLAFGIIRRDRRRRPDLLGLHSPGP